jgi:heat-inducible transcriptional repressor
MAMGEENDQVFVGGPSRLAVAFDAVETVRSVLSILEQQLVVVSLLRDVLDRGLSVAIGTEHGFEPLASCAVVVAPLSVDGFEAGAIGLLGPTRMNYPQALAAAHVVGERLGERIGDSLGRTSDAPASEPDRRGSPRKDGERRGRG